MKRIIKRMQDIRRMRLLVEIIDKLNKKKASDPVMHGFGAAYDGIERRDCINAFKEKYPKFSGVADELCDSAIARSYIMSNDKLPIPKDEKRLIVDPLQGRVLLTRSGYLNELAESVGKIAPFLTWAVALTSLVVSIIVAIYTVNK